jgi:hypothetical protein
MLHCCIGFASIACAVYHRFLSDYLLQKWGRDTRARNRPDRQLYRPFGLENVPLPEVPVGLDYLLTKTEGDIQILRENIGLPLPEINRFTGRKLTINEQLRLVISGSPLGNNMSTLEMRYRVPGEPRSIMFQEHNTAMARVTARDTVEEAHSSFVHNQFSEHPFPPAIDLVDPLSCEAYFLDTCVDSRTRNNRVATRSVHFVVAHLIALSHFQVNAPTICQESLSLLLGTSAARFTSYVSSRRPPMRRGVVAPDIDEQVASAATEFIWHDRNNRPTIQRLDHPRVSLLQCASDLTGILAPTLAPEGNGNQPLANSISAVAQLLPATGANLAEESPVLTIFRVRAHSGGYDFHVVVLKPLKIRPSTGQPEQKTIRIVCKGLDRLSRFLLRLCQHQNRRRHTGDVTVMRLLSFTCSNPSICIGEYASSLGSRIWDHMCVGSTEEDDVDAHIGANHDGGDNDSSDNNADGGAVDEDFPDGSDGQEGLTDHVGVRRLIPQDSSSDSDSDSDSDSASNSSIEEREANRVEGGAGGAEADPSSDDEAAIPHRHHETLALLRVARHQLQEVTHDDEEEASNDEGEASNDEEGQPNSHRWRRGAVQDSDSDSDSNKGDEGQPNVADGGAAFLRVARDGLVDVTLLRTRVESQTPWWSILVRDITCLEALYSSAQLRCNVMGGD